MLAPMLRVETVFGLGRCPRFVRCLQLMGTTISEWPHASALHGYLSIGDWFAQPIRSSVHVVRARCEPWMISLDQQRAGYPLRTRTIINGSRRSRDTASQSPIWALTRRNVEGALRGGCFLLRKYPGREWSLRVAKITGSTRWQLEAPPQATTCQLAYGNTFSCTPWC